MIEIDVMIYLYKQCDIMHYGVSVKGLFKLETTAISDVLNRTHFFSIHQICNCRIVLFNGDFFSESIQKVIL